MPHYVRDQGFILIIVLLFIQIFTLLSLSFLETAILSKKISLAFHEKTKMRMAERNVAKY